MTRSTPTVRTTSNRVLTILPTLLTGVLLAFAVRWFLLRWDTVIGAEGRPSIAWGWIVVAAVLLAAHAATAVAIWRQMLAVVGARLTWSQSVDSFVPSLLARYVPGKIWANAARLALARRAGVMLGTSTGAILWEMLVLLCCAGVVALGGLLLGREAVALDPAWLRAAAVLAVLPPVALLALVILARGSRPVPLLERFGGSRPLRTPAALVPAAATNLVSWLAFGAAHVAVFAALAPVSATESAFIVGAVALAWVGGYLAFLLPVGLGVRDGMLLVLLAPLLDPARALLFVALSRLVQLAVDTAITLGWLLVRMDRARREPTAAPPSA